MLLTEEVERGHTLSGKGTPRENSRRNFPTVVGGPTAVPVLAVITAIFWHYREPPKSVPPKYEIPGTAENHRQQYIGEIDSRF